MAEQTTQKGGKNRKYGRAKRSPSMQRYNIERRWEKNAKRRQERHIKRMAKHAAHLAKRDARCCLSRQSRRALLLF